MHIRSLVTSHDKRLVDCILTARGEATDIHQITDGVGGFPEPFCNGHKEAGMAIGLKLSFG